MKGNSQALIFSTVWPEPQSSAAGVRQLQWVRAFRDLGFDVTLSSPSKLKAPGEWGYTDWTHVQGVRLQPLPMNRWEVVETIRALNPQIVMFDRFIVEEQFGPMVTEACPEALQLLETQDLHFLRRSREKARVDQWANLPMADFTRDETAIREIASIERVDYSFVISSFEEKLLSQEFGLGPEKQCWIPMSFEWAQSKTSFDATRDFVWIGNFRHAPNVDGLRWFLKSIWPRVRAQLPHAQFKIYGAYPSEEFSSAHDPKGGGIVMSGSPRELNEVFESARVNVAPLRFGAGVKGKILEGFRFGVPVVTTPVGEEGILPNVKEGASLVFPGMVVRAESEFAESCVKLYSDGALWSRYQASANDLIRQVYDPTKSGEQMQSVLRDLLQQKANGKLPRFLSRILRSELLNSHKYFSKWIEQKETK